MEQVKLINSNTYKTITLNNEEFMPQPTDGGGKLIGYFEKETVQKITKTVGLSYGILTFHFYFQGGNLMYVHETRDVFVYNKNLKKLNLTKTERNFTGCYFFINNALIDYETTGHNRFENAEIDIEKTLVQEALKYLKLLKWQKC